MRFGCLVLTVCATAVAQDAWSVERLVSAEYPPLAQQAQIQGAVELTCTIGTAGEVLDCKAVSGHPLLQQAAIANAKRWRFQRSPIPDANGNQIMLQYDFILQGPPVRSRPKVEFSFEYPNQVLVSSEIPCADHIPCTPKEWKEYEKEQQHSKGKRYIP